MCVNFKKINVFRDILLFGDFFQKIVIHHKVIKKARSTKNQENSTHRFGDNNFTNYFVKFLQDKIEP